MHSATFRWPRGTGQWDRTKVVIVSADAHHRERLVRCWAEQHEVSLARTPLELILQLELEGPSISTVVISDLVGSASEAQLAQFLDACYPWLRVVAVHEPTATLDEQIELDTALTISG
jgi:hypothetical protein